MKMSDNIIGLRPIFYDLDIRLKRPNHKNEITFQAINENDSFSRKMFSMIHAINHKCNNNFILSFSMIVEIKELK